MLLKGTTVINTVDKGGTVMIGSPIMRKSLVIGITCLCIGSAFISCASRFDEVIDQHQDNFYSGQGYSVNVNEYGKAHVVAQSFKPSMTPLTKVDLAILTDNYTTQPVVVSIRSDLEGNDLTSITVPPEQIPQDNISWCSFDFPDITVVPETTYYIIIRSNDTNYAYCVGYNGSNLYPRGNTWLCYDGNWTAYYSEDCAFRTYSINTQPPTPPNITGPHYGKINTRYTFSLGAITNPDEDQFYGFWDWGDGNTSGWVGPYDHGQATNSTYAWSKPGNYTIRVKLKDIYGVESNWSAPFYIEIVRLKTKVFLGTFKSINQTKDLIILHARSFIVFPSFPIINRGEIIVLSKEFHGYLGPSFTFGVGGAAII